MSMNNLPPGVSVLDEHINPDIEPWGDCFETAMGIVFDRGPVPKLISALGLGVSDIRIVHAMVKGQGKCSGYRISHAWVEAGGLSFDFSNGKSVIMPSFIYRQIGNVSDLFSYTVDDARRKAVRAGHYGPWDFDGSIREEK